VSEQTGSERRIGFNAFGTWTRAAQAYTLSPSPTTLHIDSGSLGFGVFTFNVVETITWVDGEEPTAGIYVIVAGNEETGVKFSPDAGGAGVPGVVLLQRVDYTPVDTLSFAWGDWRDLSDEAPAYARRAALGYETFQLVLSELEVIFDGFVWVFDHNPELAGAGGAGVEVATTPYPGTGAPGNVRYAWLDDHDDGLIGPADGFRLTFTNCWCDDPGSHPDLLQDGAIRMAGYSEVASPFLTGAILTFEDYVRRETKQKGGVWHVEPRLMITGGFNVSLAAAAP
jgi:hypothetical protein